MLTVEDYNRITKAAVAGTPLAEAGVPETDQTRKLYEDAVEWAASLPEDAQVDMVKESPDSDIDDDLETLYGEPIGALGARIFGEGAGEKAKGGIDKNRGGAEKLRRYWVHGEGAAKIGWGTPGDWSRCVALLSKHMGTRAKGYCNLRHHDALGFYPGQHDGHKGAPFIDGRGLLQFKNAPVTETMNQMPDGVMVALYAPDDVANDLALPGGTPPPDMHVTLAYLGKVDDVPNPEALMDVVAEFAASHQPVDARISGVGRFVGNDDGDALYLSVDSPSLPDLRAELVAALEAVGLEVRKDHGFTPHMTLGYLNPGEAAPIESVDPASTQFGLLSMAYGPDVWDYPMGE